MNTSGYETIELVNAYFSTNKPLLDRKLVDCQKLSGGLCNYVYRLYLDDSTTAVFKYFPRFISSDRSIEFSQERYFAEKASLALLSENQYMLEHTSVRIPKLIFSDDSQYILIMQDAGEHLISLFDLLKKNETNLIDEKKLHSVGKEIHKFLKFLSDKSNITPQTHADTFENNAVLEATIKYGTFISHDQADKHNLRAELDSFLKYLPNLLEKSSDPSDVFRFGDLWPNSILIDKKELKIWIIDWELARFGKPRKDLEQLMGNLWIMKQNNKLFNVESIDCIMKTLQQEFFGDANVDWRLNQGEETVYNFIYWAVSLVKEAHWEIDDQRAVILKALEEANKI